MQEGGVGMRIEKERTKRRKEEKVEEEVGREKQSELEPVLVWQKRSMKKRREEKKGG